MSFFDRILESLERFITGGRQQEIRGRDIDEPLIRKFVSGLFYCNGIKRNHFAVIFERNEFDRENDLLQELIDEFPDCSDMREYFGYSEEEVESAETIGFMEVGTL